MLEVFLLLGRGVRGVVELVGLGQLSVIFFLTDLVVVERNVVLL